MSKIILSSEVAKCKRSNKEKKNRQGKAFFFQKEVQSDTREFMDLAASLRLEYSQILRKQMCIDVGHLPRGVSQGLLCHLLNHGVVSIGDINELLLKCTKQSSKKKSEYGRQCFSCFCHRGVCFLHEKTLFPLNVVEWSLGTPIFPVISPLTPELDAISKTFLEKTGLNCHAVPDTVHWTLLAYLVCNDVFSIKELNQNIVDCQFCSTSQCPKRVCISDSLVHGSFCNKYLQTHLCYLHQPLGFSSGQDVALAFYSGWKERFCLFHAPHILGDLFESL